MAEKKAAKKATRTNFEEYRKKDKKIILFVTQEEKETILAAWEKKRPKTSQQANLEILVEADTGIKLD